MANGGAATKTSGNSEAKLPTEFDDAVMWATWLYYADQMTQSEIAKQLNVSRATIVNLLQEAREREIVSIRISPQAFGRTAVARALMDKFGLDGVFVIPSGDEQNLADFLCGVTVLGLDTDIAKIFGRERGRLRAAGTLIGDFDLLIAAAALHQNLTLLTNNRSHFERIDGLRMESI